MSQRPTHGVEALSSRATLPAPDAVVTRPEQERGYAGALLAHFDEAQAEQVLWQAFRDHDASLNNTLMRPCRFTGVPRG
jgi:hypothetical protein